MSLRTASIAMLLGNATNMQRLVSFTTQPFRTVAHIERIDILADALSPLA